MCHVSFLCLQTAVIPLGEEEVHLVAMNSRKNLMHYACFWGFSVASGLYDSCLGMLNLRCLGIVFDLDETLIVANTLRSFEDRIDALQRKISNETDPQRVTGMLAEIKRYQDDKSILKQYADIDQVVENGKVYKVQSEVVSPLSDSHQLITRPVLRLQERNIILTRVNPSVCFPYPIFNDCKMWGIFLLDIHCIDMPLYISTLLLKQIVVIQSTV